MSTTSDIGAVASSAAAATEIGCAVLEAGGNAADAAVATAVALTVADPANASLLGRCHAVVVDGDSAQAIDGATRAPDVLGPARGRCEGHAAAPLPGLLPALERLHRGHGRMPWADLIAPSAALARAGFVVGPNLALAWAGAAADLARDAGARRHWLAADGSAPAAGSRHRLPALADLLDAIARGGAAALHADAGPALVADNRAGGGFWTEAELAGCQALDGEVVRIGYRDHELVTVGRQAWGHTLALMLALLERAPAGDGRGQSLDPMRVAIAMHEALAAQPQEIGTLSPRPAALDHDALLTPATVGALEARVARLLASAPRQVTQRVATAMRWPTGPVRDTTNLAAVDGDAMAVALTQSMGPHFGARVASREHGGLFAHSYRMANEPAPGARDRTEMTPAVLLRGGLPRLAVGGAGSERIPGATAQVIARLVDLGEGIVSAVSRSRPNWSHGALVVQDASLRERLAARGLPVAPSGHTGIVHAVSRRDDGVLEAAADPAWDGRGQVARREPAA
ncbi:MAG: gamma-glutamyltransferase [Chromatiales bacterium]|nr:gamma-glutamyltransferase [Chromatiales bacterium]